MTSSDATVKPMNKTEGMKLAWRYEVQHGPDGETDYAWVFDESNNMVCTAKTHHAKAIVKASAPLPVVKESGEQSDCVAVPKAALEWLFGAEPDADGKWFGECHEAKRAMEAKHPRRYWWRSKFRKMISAAPTPATPPAGQWQDIATAKQDGNPILGYSTEGVAYVCWYHGNVGWAFFQNHRGDRFYFEPTHWMPLPALPTSPESLSEEGVGK